VRLDRADFLQLLRNGPLVSLDLVVRDRDDRVLVGWRVNRPARDAWFVPGGRVYKDERLGDAFARITAAELGRALELPDARPLGVFEHLYDDNGLDEPGVSTHYVVLAYELRAEALRLPDAQHSTWRWMTAAELLSDPSVHPNTRAYFEASPSTAPGRSNRP
jgi:colanic acid biosynthesis protein WcaH